MLGVALTAFAVVLFAAGAVQWGAAVLALAVIFMFVLVLLSYGYTVRTAVRAREVQQRDTRTLHQGIDKVSKASASTKSKVNELTGTFDAAGLRTVVKADSKALTDDAKKAVRRDMQKASTGNSMGGAGAYYGIGAEFEYGERAGKAPGHFETFALRAKSVRMRDAFARSATNLQFDYGEMLRIVRALRAGKAPGAGAVVLGWSYKGVLATARVVANQRLAPSDSGDAVLLFRLVKDVFGVDKLGRSDAYIFAEAAALEGQHREAARLFRETKLARRDPMQFQLMDLNARHKRGLERSENREAWAERINAVYESEGLAPITFHEPLRGTLLDSLTSAAPARTVDGPLVSVLVPTFNGSELIGTTLDSLVNQTWKNLEIIVVDDFSDSTHRERLHEVCARYEDVTLLLQPENLGAYMARNRALAVASGEFITVHDDDDWSHPQKLELQVNHLLEDSSQSANMSRHARASEDLLLTRINNNPSFSQPNFSSLMARRVLIEQLGGWDTVNRGADAEFRDRLVKFTGQPVEVVGTVPHSFTRTHGASLTAGEIGRGYIDPSRLFYQAAYFRSLHNAEVTETGL
ncbi:MAG: glycosyltransferase family 2 protein, partial [Microbacterium sp.]